MDDSIILFCDNDPLRAAKMYEWQSESERKRTIWVKTVKETIKVLKECGNRIEQLHLDLDLEGDNHNIIISPESGAEIVRFFHNLPQGKRNKYIMINVIVHDHDRYAALDQLKRLRKMGFQAKYIPFGLEDEIDNV
jgi:hypothetical protein